MAVISLSLTEILGIVGVVGLILGVWIDARIRIASLEVRTQMLREQFDKSCEDHNRTFESILSEVKELSGESRQTLQELNLQVERLKIITSKLNQ